MKIEKLDEEQIVNAIDQEIAQADSDDTHKLSEQRRKSMEYYYGRPFGNEPAEGSNIVTREVMDTIEWIKPELMKKFASGDDTVRFEPTGPNDVQQAEQDTDYINYLFNRKNNGFKILYEWITDGLLQKNGVVKCWWDRDESIEREEYADVTEAELQMLLSYENIELLEQKPVEGPTAQPLYNVAVAVVGAQNGLKIEPLPPEEFIISSRAKDIQSSPFCCHRRLTSVSDIRAMGYDVPEDAELDFDSSVNWEEEKRARHSYDDSNPEDHQVDPSSEAMRECWLEEAYIKIDANGDGIAEILKVCKSGKHVFDQEEVEHMPFAGWTPIIISHKFHGLSMADLVADLQRLHSQLLRNLLDNQYLTNNGRYTALENMVNLGDFQRGGPHNAIRIKTPGALQRLDIPQLGATAFQMLDYVDRLREKRTGVSERTQGLDPNALGPNTAAHAVNQVMTASQQRIELIARVFGETGLKDLFLLMHKEVRQNATHTDIVRLRDSYVEVDPTEWRERKNATAVVGLGNGSRENEIMQIQGFFQNQMQLMQNPKTAGIVNAQNVYNAMEDMVKLTSKASQGRYFTDPNSPEAKQAQQQETAAQEEAKNEQKQINQQKYQLDQQRVVNDRTKAETDRFYKQGQLQLERRAQDQDMEKHEDTIALDTAELQLEAALEAEQERGVELG